MRNRQAAQDARRVRRWIGVVVCVVAVGIIALVAPRVLPRSPLVILLVCALAVLTMKIVEHRVRRWFDRWESRQATRVSRRK
jgi:peptidoglycan/LPS O-acetylase OafA/YrhL